VALSLPDAPYDAVFWLETDTPIEINVNGQGYVEVALGYISMSQTTTVLVRNILVPGGTVNPVIATIRYFAGSRET